MSRYNFMELPGAATGSQRSRLYDSGHFPLSPSSDRRSSLTSSTLANDFQRTEPDLQHQQQGQQEGMGADLDTKWIFPQPDLSQATHSISTLWTRPAQLHSYINQAGVTNTHTQTTDSDNKARVAASSSPVSPFNHNYRAPFSGYPSATSPLYTLFPNDYSREPSENFFQPPSTVPIPVSPSSLASLPHGNIDSFQPLRSPISSQQPVKSPAASSTLWWGDIEPWMDEEYAKKVCDLMMWEQVTVKIPHSPADPATGQQVNNPGYCFLTFPTPQQAAAALSQINNAATSGHHPILPNSTKPFVLNWASSSSPSPTTQTFPITAAVERPPSTSNSGGQVQQREYSIFVGDLAPEVSNSDLVAVFRNPVLGLRSDRAPKFIQPFDSCKSAKIMLDPVTGVSRGYGFVRFADESDQQRALIEMHGLYCLSRPMRISPATAKFKGPNASDGQPLPIDQQGSNGLASVTTSRSGSSIGSSGSVPSMTSSSTASSVSSSSPNGSQPTVSLEALVQLIARANLMDPKRSGNNLPSITAPLVMDQKKLDESQPIRIIQQYVIIFAIEMSTSSHPLATSIMYVAGLRESIVDLSNSSEKQMPNGPSRECKVSLLVAVESGCPIFRQGRTSGCTGSCSSPGTGNVPRFDAQS